jgi:acetyl-CoA carboxylase biotin carboxyl carrier protein
MDLSDVDVTDILALIDSLPYDELDLRTGRFRLILRRTPDGWTQSAQVLSALDTLDPAPPDPRPIGSMAHWVGSSRTNGTSTQSGEDGKGDGGADETDGETEAAPGGAAGAAGGAAGAAAGRVAVRAPLPGTFYRAPRPGAAPFVEVGSRVSADTVIGIVETMKLMNSVAAGVAGTVAEFCLANAEFAAHGATLMRIRADP